MLCLPARGGHSSKLCDGLWVDFDEVFIAFYAALLPRRGRHISSHSVCLSVRLSVCPSVPLSSLTSVTWRHLANYNDTHVLFGKRRGPHIVRPSRPHKLVSKVIALSDALHSSHFLSLGGATIFAKLRSTIAKSQKNRRKSLCAPRTTSYR